MTPLNLDDDTDLDALTEMQLVDLYTRVRTLLAVRLTRHDGSESLEMLFARLAELTDPPSAPGAAISPREREVLHFLTLGKTNADIAAALFLSPHTVKRHVQSITRKYGVTNRHDAVLAALRQGALVAE